MDSETIRQLVERDLRIDHAYSQDVRRAVGRYARRRRAEGARWSDIADEVGVSGTSARTWMLAMDQDQKQKGFHEVVIIDPPAIEVPLTELTITSPAGFLLTGCSLDQAIAAMQRLR